MFHREPPETATSQESQDSQSQDIFILQQSLALLGEKPKLNRMKNLRQVKSIDLDLGETQSWLQILSPTNYALNSSMSQVLDGKIRIIMLSSHGYHWILMRKCKYKGAGFEPLQVCSAINLVNICCTQKMCQAPGRPWRGWTELNGSWLGWWPQTRVWCEKWFAFTFWYSKGGACAAPRFHQSLFQSSHSAAQHTFSWPPLSQEPNSLTSWPDPTPFYQSQTKRWNESTYYNSALWGRVFVGFFFQLIK